MRRRTRRLALVLALGGALLVLRLAQIQVVENELWSEEAARLVHSGRVVPFRRGAILEADGRVLARDVLAYHLVLSYRDFRRLHPLGQVAHARSLLEMRAVPLPEALARLDPWAEELVSLSPEELARFARGGALATPSLEIAPTAKPSETRRRSRAADARFYVRELLGAAPAEWRGIRALDGDAAERPYVELLARARGVEPEALLAELRARWTRSAADLASLAARIEPTRGGEDPLALLVLELEGARRAVEEAAASSLFEAAAGFRAGRIEAETLLAFVDLEPLRRLLAWSADELDSWARNARRRWLLHWRDGWALPRLAAELRRERAEPIGPEDVLSALAALFAEEEDLAAALDGEPRPWRDLDRLGVLAALPSALAAPVPRAEVEAAALPFQDPSLRALELEGERAWELLDLARGAALGDGDEPRAPRWRRALSGRGAARYDECLALAGELAGAWEHDLQAAVAGALAAARDGARRSELSPEGKLLLAASRVERAAERADYALRDHGSRELPLDQRPDYDVVHLLTRFPERYPGFEARDARERVRPAADLGGGDEGPLAEPLVGFVSGIDVADLQRQRRDARRLRELRASPERAPEEEDELALLVASVLLPDEVRGAQGIEGLFDRELRGRNGYRESRGLEEVFGEDGGWTSVVEPVDGADVVLTLDAEVQRAAERTIARPEPPADDPHADLEWFARPVGAIVLATPEGDVLAAASAPRDGAGGLPALERTLRRPGFQPPGSVLKPFAAAWALDLPAFDPTEEVACEPDPDDGGHAGHRGLRCWNRWGHGPVDLHAALVGSCNAYFAWLGSALASDDLRAFADAFGIGRPTGVTDGPPWDPGPRAGLREDWRNRGLAGTRALPDELRMRAANGLSVVEATPMQIARAYAAIATGRLPRMRLARAVGGEELPRAPAEPVPLSARGLARVRAALVDVAEAPGGTSHGVLDAASLGFSVAVKTGSADLVGRAAQGGEPARVRKHTWVAGWTPVEEPALVFVVFCSDTSATSSHGAVHVARQLLLQPAVRAWLAERGVPLEEPR